MLRTVLLSATGTHAESRVDFIKDQRYFAISAHCAQLVQPVLILVILVRSRAHLGIHQKSQVKRKTSESQVKRKLAKVQEGDI